LHGDMAGSGFLLEQGQILRNDKHLAFFDGIGPTCHFRLRLPLAH
jgi:hypothetical protein